MIIGIIIFVLGAIYCFYQAFIKEQNQESVCLDDSVNHESNKDFSQSYQRKYLFTLNEKNEFRKLAAWAKEHNYYVFPKMRLADIIEPRRGDNYMSLFGKIKSKHVDFVVCDPECRIRFIIELDDNSHNAKNRADRDDFVGQACRGAGYTVIHTRAFTGEFFAGLTALDSTGLKE